MNDRHELVCVVCPQGCLLQAEWQDGWKLTGYACPRGREYAFNELTAPMRTVSTSLPVTGGKYRMVSVRPNRPIPKHMVLPAMKSLSGMSLSAPIQRGQIIIEDWLGMGVDLIATRTVLMDQSHKR